MKIHKISPRLASQLDKEPPGGDLPIIVKLRTKDRTVKALGVEFPVGKQFR